MMLKRTAMILSTLALVPLQSMAALQCEAGLTHVSVSGNVTTLNVSETKQVGQICMTLIQTTSGREIFDDCGALVGKVTASDLQAGTSTLAHTAVFDFRNLFITQNDQAQITTPPLAYDDAGAPCAFGVSETISQIDKSAGIFRGGQINVTATGNISFCPGNNLNTFTLQGEACVKE
jgi:hypothetical protein